jgi:ABC-2 type transport system ATP-binding protein
VTSAIRTHGLTKRYGRLVVVDSVDLDVPEGEIFGFLGPNGSGKTTTIRMLLGLVFSSGGGAELLGHAVPRQLGQALPQVGTLVEAPGFYPTLSGRRNLAMFDAAGRGGRRRDRRARIEASLDRVGLGGIDRRPVRAYSMGMRQRLGLAAALLRDPRLLVLDEPTNGLDPAGIQELRTLFTSLAAEGTTVFLSSHLLGEVELICTHAAMLANGRLVAQDTVAKLRSPTGHVLLLTPDLDAAAATIASLGLVQHPSAVERAGEHLRVRVDGVAPEHLNAELVRAGVRVREMVVERKTLEVAFLGLTGESGVARR